MRKNKSQKNHILLLSKIFALLVVSVVVIAGLVGSVYGQVDNPGYICDSEICASWEVNFDTGEGLYIFGNFGSETRTEFWWITPDLLTLTAPSGWTYTYDLNNDLVKLIGQSDKLQSGEDISIPFTFDPTDKELGYGNLDYFGDETSGTLQNIGEINVVPEPVSSALFVVGGAVFGARRYFKRKRSST